MNLVKSTARDLLINMKGFYDNHRSRFVDSSDIKSVALILGPYRNLTTLTSSILFLHPHCQVLNHAFDRIFNHKHVDFLQYYTSQTFERFIEYAIQISKSGRRGDYGGSILLSHAFVNNPELQNIYHRRFGDAVIKDEIRCLFWKESLRVVNHIRDNQIDLSAILEREPRLRFIVPVRDPIDCAQSHLKTSHWQLFPDLHVFPTLDSALTAIMNEYVWIAELQRSFPERVFIYYEHSYTKETLLDLALFLELDTDEEWVEDALSIFNMKSKYTHSQEIRVTFNQLIEEKFRAFPEIAREMQRFDKNRSG